MARSTIEANIGHYNISRGLLRWRLARALCAKTVTGTGLGGVDVLVMGDSLFVGYYAVQEVYSNLANRMKPKLQAAYNPPGVPGGFGYLGFGDSCIFETGWSVVNNATTNGGTLVTYLTSTTPGARLLFKMDGTTNAIFKAGVTSVDYALKKGTSFGTVRYDVVSGTSYVTPGAGSHGTGTASLSGTSAPMTMSGATIANTPLTPASAYSVQFSNTGTARIDVNGIIMYNGDETCGVRVHNLSVGGMSARLWVQNAGVNQASVDRFCTGNTFGATKARLVISNYITNDIFQGSTPEEFKENLTTVVQYLTSKNVSVVLLIPAKPDNRIWSEFNNYADYVAVVYEVCDENDHVCIIDEWQMLGNGEWSDWEALYRWGHSDGLHRTDLCQEAWSEIIVNTIK